MVSMFIFMLTIPLLTEFLHSSPKFLEHLWTLYLAECLFLFHFSSFSGDFSCSFIWGMFLYLPILAVPRVCFCVLGRSAISPSLGMVALRTGCLWGAVAQSPWSPALGAPGMFFVWVVWALLLYWVLITVGSSMGGVDPQTGLLWGLTLTILSVGWLPSQSRIHSSRVWCLLRSPFGCALWS